MYTFVHINLQKETEVKCQTFDRKKTVEFSYETIFSYNTRRIRLVLGTKNLADKSKKDNPFIFAINFMQIKYSFYFLNTQIFNIFFITHSFWCKEFKNILNDFLYIPSCDSRQFFLYVLTYYCTYSHIHTLIFSKAITKQN